MSANLLQMMTTGSEAQTDTAPVSASTTTPSRKAPRKPRAKVEAPVQPTSKPKSRSKPQAAATTTADAVTARAGARSRARSKVTEKSESKAAPTSGKVKRTRSTPAPSPSPSPSPSPTRKSRASSVASSAAGTTSVHGKPVLKRKEKLPKRNEIIRRPTPAWLLFNKEHRDKTKTFTENAQYLAKIWSNLSHEQRLPYINVHIKDKERFEEEKKNLTPEKLKMLRLITRANREKRADEPKKPKSAYLFFTNEYRKIIMQETPGIKFAEIACKLSEIWSTITESEKRRFNIMHDREQEEYNVKRAEYDLNKKKIKEQNRAAKLAKAQTRAANGASQNRKRHKTDPNSVAVAAVAPDVQPNVTTPSLPSSSMDVEVVVAQ